MTREEVIKILSTRDAHGVLCGYTSGVTEALEMAIEALSAELSATNTEKSSNCGDLISRADAMGTVQDHFNADGFKGYDDGQKMMDRIKALPSAEAEPTVIRSKTLMPTKDFKEWAKRVREENQNVIVIPCDAEVVSADRPAGEWVRSGNTLICPICGAKGEDIKDDYCFNYCPNCGADMRNQNNEQC